VRNKIKHRQKVQDREIGTGLSQKGEMVVSQEPAMGFSQNNFSLETSESKRVRFLAAATTRDKK
jgi:hypothetical protein